MLSIADYAVLAFYFVFMMSMGWVFKRFIRNTSDYFRSGGEMLWWIVGAGAFMTNFSAVSFTGMAGKAYDDGPLVLVIFFGGALGFLNGPITPFFARLTQAVRNGGCETSGSVEAEYDGWIPFAQEMGAMMFCRSRPGRLSRPANCLPTPTRRIRSIPCLPS